MVIEINGHKINEKSKEYIKLKIAPMLDGNELFIPLHVISGIGEGPVLGLFACIHGSEYYQNRILKKIVDNTEPEELKGTLLVVPVANPYAFSHTSRETPNPPEETVDFANMNRLFPGKRLTPLFGSMESTDVSLTMRMASVITDNVVKKCTHILDFHGQMKGMALKKMLFNLDSQSKQLAQIFGLGLLHDPPSESYKKGAFMPLTAYAGSLGIPSIVPEIGGGGHGEDFEEKCEKIGVMGTRNVMIQLGMINGEPIVPDRQFYYVNAPHVRSTVGGYFVSDLSPYDVGIGRDPREVKKGEVLGSIYNPYSLKELEQIKSPCNGLIYACRVSGLVQPQSEILAVADFQGSKWI